MTASQVSQAYALMQAEGIVDPSDFIDAHRPSAVVAPTITVTAPNGGENWALSIPHTISWSVAGDPSQIDHFLVSYSLDGGATYMNDLPTVSGTTRSTSWTPPLIISPAALGQIRVQAFNVSNSLLSQDFSDGNFTFGSTPTSATKVVGYVTNWDAHIDYSMLTQVNYAFLTAKSDGTLNSINLSTLGSVVSAAHSVGTHVSIAVQCYDSPVLHNIAATPSALSTFSNQLVQFVAQNNLDGVDLDWEADDNIAADTPNPTDYGNLIDALHGRGLLVSAAVNAIAHQISLSSVPELDSIEVMDYDLKLPNHADYGDSVNYLNGWVDYGVPKSKLLMGVPFYGHDQHTTWATTTEASYNAIVEATHPPLNVDVIYNPATGNTWYYNGVNTISSKTQYVVANGFGGMMIWQLSQDHFDAQGNYDQWSLLPTIRGVVTGNATPPVVTVNSLTTNDPTPQLTGAVDDSAATIRVTVAGHTYDAANNHNGSWTLADNTISPALADGRYDVVVNATGLSGGIGTDNTTNELLVDTTRPTSHVNALARTQTSLWFRGLRQWQRSSTRSGCACFGGHELRCVRGG